MDTEWIECCHYWDKSLGTAFSYGAVNRRRTCSWGQAELFDLVRIDMCECSKPAEGGQS